MNDYQNILAIAREASLAGKRINGLSYSLNNNEYHDIKEKANIFCQQAYELEMMAKNITVKNKKNNGFDKLLGKNLMGIFAAMLIFITKQKKIKKTNKTASCFHRGLSFSISRWWKHFNKFYTLIVFFHPHMLFFRIPHIN